MKVFRHLSEAGLSTKWINDEMDAVAKQRKTAQRPEHNPFTVYHLQVMRLIKGYKHALHIFIIGRLCNSGMWPCDKLVGIHHRIQNR